MLKWAVNQPRPSYLAGTGEHLGHAINSYSDFHPAATPIALATPTPTPSAAGQKLKRKRHSLLHIQAGKENHLTSTPLPASAAGAPASGCGAVSPPRATPLLRDLSNILSPLHATTPIQSKPKPKPKPKPRGPIFASTLPTFEAEYSPSHRDHRDLEDDIIPGALLALRGMGIPDSYFEKPRYLQHHQLAAAAAAAPLASGPSSAPSEEQTTLSSSRMGDVTLERMIDAILESTRKAPAAARPRPRPRPRLRPRSRSRSRCRPSGRPAQSLQPRPVPSSPSSHSPTYRPAFDPASDLSEYWQPPVHPDVYEEREVCSPQAQAQAQALAQAGSGSGSCSGKRSSLQLRRQRVVRRKRKIATKISSSVRQSAQKLLAAASRSGHKQPPAAQPARHISPDSGHNSTSDCELELQLELEQEQQLGEELEASCQLDAIRQQAELRDVTKRRLSFSLSESLPEL